MRIACRPAFLAANPYPAMLARSLQARGAEIHEMGFPLSTYPWRAEIVVLHWPDEFFVRVSLRKALRALVLLGLMALAKLVRRQRIVWIVHNIKPHDHGSPFPLARRAFFALVDGLVFLSQASRDILLGTFPALARKPALVIRHGHYKAVARTPVRPATPVRGRPVRLAFVGQVRRYKAPDVLARIIGAMPAGEVTLSIAGFCPDEPFADDLRAFCRETGNVSLDLRRLSDEEFERHVDEADAAVLPYRDILNSGSALFALSRARPIMAPRMGSLVELQQEVGADWVHLYDGDLDRSRVERFIAAVRDRQRAPEPDLRSHDWETIGRDFDLFLRRLHGGATSVAPEAV